VYTTTYKGDLYIKCAVRLYLEFYQCLTFFPLFQNFQQNKRNTKTNASLLTIQRVSHSSTYRKSTTLTHGMIHISKYSLLYQE